MNAASRKTSEEKTPFMIPLLFTFRLKQTFLLCACANSKRGFASGPSLHTRGEPVNMMWTFSVVLLFALSAHFLSAEGKFTLDMCALYPIVSVLKCTAHFFLFFLQVVTTHSFSVTMGFVFPVGSFVT